MNNVILGGLKIWECTMDLLEYIHQSTVDFVNLKVLDVWNSYAILVIDVVPSEL